MALGRPIQSDAQIRLTAEAADANYEALFKIAEKYYTDCIDRISHQQPIHLTVSDVTSLFAKLTSLINQYGLEVLKITNKNLLIKRSGQHIGLLALLSGLTMMTNNPDFNIDMMFYLFDTYNTKLMFDFPLSELSNLYLRTQDRDHKQALNTTRLALRPYKTAKICNTVKPLSEMQAHTRLFGSSASGNNKQIALQRSISQLLTLYSGGPVKCLPYLQFLNQEFVRFCRESMNADFPTLEEDLTFRLIDGDMYPFPTDVKKYRGIKKFCMFQKFIISHLRQFGLGEHAYKWTGFVPHRIADKIIVAGNIAMDEMIGPGLCHGKSIHPIQIAIATCAITNGDINTQYGDAAVTIRDILTALVNTPSHDDPRISLWVKVLDNRSGDTLRFSYPMSLNSWIMQYGKAYGLREMAASLTDTFCKGFIKLLAAFERQGYPLTANEYIECLNDSKLNTFYIPSFLIEDFKDKQAEKNKNDIVDESHQSFVTEKRYKLNKKFKPTLFRMPTTAPTVEAPTAIAPTAAAPTVTAFQPINARI